MINITHVSAICKSLETQVHEAQKWGLVIILKLDHVLSHRPMAYHLCLGSAARSGLPSWLQLPRYGDQLPTVAPN